MTELKFDRLSFFEIEEKLDQEAVLVCHVSNGISTLR